MIRIRNLFAAALTASICAAGTAAYAQSSDSETTQASVTIFRPISLTKHTDLAFGTVVRPATGQGTVIVATDGQRSVSGGVVGLTVGPSATFQAATFTVAGEGGQTFAITVNNSMIMTRNQGSETITVTLQRSAVSGLLSGSLGDAGNGTASFSVGGQIAVASNTASGSYSGTFNVQVEYN